MNLPNFSAASPAVLTLALLGSFLISGTLGASVTCIDEPEDYLHNQFNIELIYPADNFSSSCHDASCIPVTLTDDAGEVGNASGFLILHPPSGNRLRLGWDDEETEGTAYFYIRYYIRASPPLDGNNVSAFAHFSHETCDEPPCELDATQDGVWKEHCGVGKPGLATQPGRFLEYHNYFEPNNYGDYMIIDKIIYVRLGADEPELECSPDQVEHIQQFCSENPPTYATESPMTTQSNTSAQPSDGTTAAPEDQTTFWTTTEESSSTPSLEATSVTCIDHLEDYEKHGWTIDPNGDWSYCDDASCVPFHLTGDTNQESSGFVVMSPIQNSQGIYWNNTDPLPGDMDYLYVRYYVHRYGHFLVYFPSSCVYGCRDFDINPNLMWKEICIEGNEIRKDNKLLVFSKQDFVPEGGMNYAVIDKIIHVRVGSKGPKPRCSAHETDDIKEYCSWKPPTTTVPPSTSTLSPSPEPTFLTTTEQPPSTPLPELPEATNVNCLDHIEDYHERGWEIGRIPNDGYSVEDWTYCEDASCLPFQLSGDTDQTSSGFVVFNSNQTGSGHMMNWTDTSWVEDIYYIYIRYYTHGVWDLHPMIKCQPGDYQNCHSFDSTPNLVWKERCIVSESGWSHFGHYRQMRILPYDNDTRILVIDKIIYVRLDMDGPQLRCSSTETDDIKQYCSSKPPTTTISSSTSTLSSSQEPEPSSPSSMPTSTFVSTASTPNPPITSSEPPSISPTFPTSTTPLPGGPDLQTEWVDFESDLQNYAWSTSNSLKYVLNTAELPFAISRNLTGATGLFYFHGKPEDSSEVQEIKRPKSSKTGEANLYIRYYIHHTSPTDSHRYYVSPVEDKFDGVHYLDATSDFRWKEALLHLDVDESNVSFRIGTTNDDEDQDIFVIDKIIFTQRLSD